MKAGRKGNLNVSTEVYYMRVDILKSVLVMVYELIQCVSICMV